MSTQCCSRVPCECSYTYLTCQTLHALGNKRIISTAFAAAAGIIPFVVTAVVAAELFLASVALFANTICAYVELVCVCELSFFLPFFSMKIHATYQKQF